jgi:hypothetical protein
MLLLLIAIVISSASSKACLSLEKSSEINDKVNLSMIGLLNWKLLAQINPLESVDDRPFHVPSDSFIHVKTHRYLVETKYMSWERLKIELYCAGDESKRTSVEFTNVFDLTNNIKLESVYRFCSGVNLLAWRNVAVAFDNSEKYLMFYSCNKETEFVTVFGSTLMITKDQRENVEEMTRKNLKSLDSKLMELRNLTFVENSEKSPVCEEFKHVCNRND